MTRLALLFAAFSMAIVPTAAGANPQSPPGQNGHNAELLGFCTSLFEIFPTLNFGECMSYNLSSDAGFKTRFCDMLVETGVLGDYGYTSYSDCVRNPPWES